MRCRWVLTVPGEMYRCEPPAACCRCAARRWTSISQADSRGRFRPLPFVAVQFSAALLRVGGRCRGGDLLWAITAALAGISKVMAIAGGHHALSADNERPGISATLVVMNWFCG